MKLARAFNVFARTASLEHTTRLLKEKTSQMRSTASNVRLEEALLHARK